MGRKRKQTEPKRLCVVCGTSKTFAGQWVMYGEEEKEATRWFPEVVYCGRLVCHKQIAQARHTAMLVAQRDNIRSTVREKLRLWKGVTNAEPVGK